MHMQNKCPIQDQNYENKEEKYKNDWYHDQNIFPKYATLGLTVTSSGLYQSCSFYIKTEKTDMSNSHQFLCNITVMRKRLDQGNEKYFETSWKKTERQIYKVLNFSNNKVWWNFLLQGSNILEVILAGLTSRQLGKLLRLKNKHLSFKIVTLNPCGINEHFSVN